ncbi:trypsin-like peptidase domain-containing protein [Allokutzneria albata]|uniref:Putative serine protease PepD n=1 Tax=Allokutzneria albata TaxID=211114 RepID=A0A1H0B407_ALLAB|nr:trypsin-like peptidase domain-containing protein [Allokutzneria albata]SDN40386.1 putative serine protease PepD [Allokutzneria albata]
MTDNTSGASGGQPERPQQPTEGNTPQQQGVPEANAPQQPFPGYGGQPHPQQDNGAMTNPLGIPMQGHQQQVPTRPRPQSGRGKLVAGALVFALLGGVAGGVGGGVLGYNLALNGSSINALDAPRPDASNVNSPAPAGTVEAVAQKVLPSVVQLQTQSGSGSGVVLSSDGMILTNNHVVEEAAAGGGQIRIQFKDGRTAPAKIIGVDPTSDLAVVKADGVSGLTPVELGRSGNLRVGQQVVAIGAPFGLSNTVTSGIVSALQRPVRTGNEAGDSTVMDAVQTDAAINPGNSGGPLVDMSGKVIGINTAIKTASGGQQQSGGSIGLGFAIPIDQAIRIANELRTNGKATHAVLGVTLSQQQAGSRSAVTNGAVVGTVEPNSAAEAAGIKQGDVITKLDDRRISDADSLIAAVRSHNPNSKVKVTVSSGGAEREVELTLGSRVLSGG